jgi:hypothetical protein
VLACGAVVAEAMFATKLHVVVGLLGAVSLVFGPISLLFAGPLSARRRVDFDTKLGVVRRAAGNKSALFRAISSVRVRQTGPGLGPKVEQLQLVLRGGDVWALHAAAEPRGSEILHAMADEIARVTGIVRG